MSPSPFSMPIIRSPALFAAAISLAAAGCGESSAGKRGHDAGTTTPREPDAGGNGGPSEAGAAPECQGPSYGGSAPNQNFSHLSAVVVDEAGKPVDGLLAQACGTNVCLNGKTQADGRVTIDAMQPLIKPAFKYGQGRQYVRFALPLSGDTVDVDLGKEMTFAFDPPAMGAPLEAGRAASSNGITLTLPPGGSIDFDVFDFDTPDLTKFRAREIPIDEAPAAVDASLGFGMLIALTPSGAVLCPAARLSVPNSPSWAAGSPVEFFLHGIEIDEQWAPYGGWAKVAAGAVSADGTTIETDRDGGLPALSVIGIRLAK